MKRAAWLIPFFLILGVVACRRDMTPAQMSGHTLYHCAMHPQIVRDKPGDCPICQMRLVPIEGTETANPDYAMPLPPGQGRVKIPGSREQLIGVKIATAQLRPMDPVVRAAARVAYDPALYTAILGHQQAVAAQKNLSSGAGDAMRDETAATIRASALRLRQMGLSDEQIRRFGDAKEPPTNLLLGSAGGTLWVYADLYDYEAGLVHAGAHAILTTPAYPGRSFEGRVRAIDSVLNSETRTLRARIEVPNPDNALKPEMYLTAEIHTSLGEHLAVPTAAILDTGEHRIVYVALGNGRYEPREVRVGREADGYTEILGGLKAGDTVVATANFFIDSESKFQSAAGMKP